MEWDALSVKDNECRNNKDSNNGDIITLNVFKFQSVCLNCTDTQILGVVHPWFTLAHSEMNLKRKINTFLSRNELMPRGLRHKQCCRGQKHSLIALECLLCMYLKPSREWIPKKPFSAQYTWWNWHDWQFSTWLWKQSILLFAWEILRVYKQTAWISSLSLYFKPELGVGPCSPLRACLWMYVYAL